MAKTVIPAKAAKRSNPHRGSSFDDFLREHGIFDATQEKAIARAQNEQIEDSLRSN